jgi:hypothetical protein
MLEELRLYPRLPGMRTEGRSTGRRASTDSATAYQGLSTSFADRPARASTGARAPIHSTERARTEGMEVVD